MALTDIFRPKYKHSDADVRAEAVRELGPGNEDLLVKIAGSDDSQKVRLLAIERIEDPELLVDVMANQNDPDTRREVERRAADFWLKDALLEDSALAAAALTKLSLLDDQSFLADVIQRAPLSDIRSSALSRMSDEKALADLVRKAKDGETRKLAIGRIDDVEVLRAIAMDETRKAVGLAAVERIDDAGVLDLLAAKAKSKHVRTRAKKKLAEGKEEPAAISDEERRDHAARVQIYNEVKLLANTNEWVQSHALITDAQASWDGLGDDPDDGLTSKFRQAVMRYLRRYETIGKRSIAAKEEREEKERQGKERAEREADQLARMRESSDEEADEEALAVVSEEMEEAFSGPMRAAAEEPQQAKERELARAEKHTVNMARLEALCIELDEVVAWDKYRDIDKKVTQAGKVFGSLRALPTGDEREALVERYEDVRRRLIIRSKELREADDWKRWSAAPKLEALIQRATQLLEAEADDSLGTQLKQLQSEWKEVGPAPHDKNQDLWDRFKTTCDQVYNRVRAGRAGRNEEKKENLAAKRELCEKVEALIDSTDWDETAAEIKRLQGQWKEIGPVPRKQSTALWKRFRTACDAFFERRAPHLDERLAEQGEQLERKTAIVEELEVLSGSKDEWQVISGQLNDLRDQWRDVGRVPRKDAGPLNKRYRAACDAVFQLRHAEQQAKATEVTREVEGYLSELDVAMSAEVDSGWDEEPATDNDSNGNVVRLASALNMARGKLPASEEALSERAAVLIKAAVESYADAFAGTSLDPRSSVKARERLCERLESLLPTTGDGDDIRFEMPADQVAAKLQEALAENALGGVSADKDARPREEILAEINQAWNALAPVPGKMGAETEHRFETARIAVLEDIESGQDDTSVTGVDGDPLFPT